MADPNEAKTKTIGYLPIEKVQILNGWDDYVDKASKLSTLRTETQAAKNFVREALKQRLNEDGDIDFDLHRAPKLRRQAVIAATRETCSGQLELGEDLMTIDIGDRVTVERQQVK